VHASDVPDQVGDAVRTAAISPISSVTDSHSQWIFLSGKRDPRQGFEPFGVGLRLLNRSVSLGLAVPSKCAFVADMNIYRAVQVDDAGDSWSVLVSEDGGPYEWLPVTYYTFAAAEAAIVRFKQAEAGATFSRDRAATPAWIRQRRFCF
jgi:hypothetical protein